MIPVERGRTDQADSRGALVPKLYLGTPYFLIRANQCQSLPDPASTDNSWTSFLCLQPRLRYAIVAKNFVYLAKLLLSENIYRKNATIFMAHGLHG